MKSPRIEWPLKPKGFRHQLLHILSRGPSPDEVALNKQREDRENREKKARAAAKAPVEDNNP